MRMEVSEHGSPVFIRVIRVIRGLFTVYFGLIPRAEILVLCHASAAIVQISGQ